jgi:hypothetical protein
MHQLSARLRQRSRLQQHTADRRIVGQHREGDIRLQRLRRRLHHPHARDVSPRTIPRLHRMPGRSQIARNLAAHCTQPDDADLHQRMPPEPRMISPVTRPASLEARKATIGAMSCTWPTRPSRVRSSFQA